MPTCYDGHMMNSNIQMVNSCLAGDAECAGLTIDAGDCGRTAAAVIPLTGDE